MSVAMTNCGSLGWVTDKKGYRYERADPEQVNRGRHASFISQPGDHRSRGRRVSRLHPGRLPGESIRARRAANPASGKNERDFSNPIASVPPGLPAMFLFGGLERNDRTICLPVGHGDVLLWAGPARLRYHGIMPLKDGVHPSTGPYRFNLTFREAA